MLKPKEYKCENSPANHSLMIYASLGLIGLTLISASILASSLASATSDSVVDEINITVPISCTLTGTGMNTHNAEIPNGTYRADIGITTLKAFCNDNNGFSIYAAGYTGNEIGETNSNKLVGTAASSNATIITGAATSAGNPDISNWAMKLSTITSPTPTYPIVIAGSTDDTEKEQGDPDFSTYTVVPNTYTKVAYRTSATDIGDNAEGVTLTTTYAAYISKTQAADTYSGQVIYTLVHPSEAEAPLSPKQTASGKICYYANASTAIGTMGCQAVDASDTSATLFASNFSRNEYGFAGWSDAYDYVTNQNAHFYGPNEEITFTAGQYTGDNAGLSLYAVWVHSAGNMQDSSRVSNLCSDIIGSLDPVNYNSTTGGLSATLSSISALTDIRDGQTYAIAKLADNNCWMIENLRLDNTAELTTLNTNNPLNDNDPINPIVTIKHNYYDTTTYSTLSMTSNEGATTNGWCTQNSAPCNNQSRLRTVNTANRTTYTTGQTMSLESNIYSYGNYYNWYSATAGRGTFDKSTGNTEGDICPSGWKLPYGNNGVSGDNLGGTSGGFSYLDQQMGGAGTNSSTNSVTNTSMSIYWRKFPNNIIFSGYVSGAALYSRGSYGYYWTSTASNSSYTYFLFLSGNPYNNFNSGTSANSKNLGRTIRCIAS